MKNEYTKKLISNLEKLRLFVTEKLGVTAFWSNDSKYYPEYEGDFLVIALDNDDLVKKYLVGDNLSCSPEVVIEIEGNDDAKDCDYYFTYRGDCENWLLQPYINFFTNTNSNVQKKVIEEIKEFFKQKNMTVDSIIEKPITKSYEELFENF